MKNITAKEAKQKADNKLKNKTPEDISMINTVIQIKAEDGKYETGFIFHTSEDAIHYFHQLGFTVDIKQNPNAVNIKW